MNNSKTIWAWCCFDWANSAYSLVITATIFPVYYNSATRNAFKGDTVLFFNMPIENTVLYSYSMAASFLLIALLSPMLSGIADFGGKKKEFMRFFTLLGSLSCLTLYFFTGENIELGVLAAVTASIGFSGGLVFYNAYLPEIASPDQYDSVSAKGFSLGYIGSVLLLIFNLLMVQKPEWFGLTDGGQAARIAFLLVGVWWLGFSQITFLYLPKSTKTEKHAWKVLISKGFNEIKKVATELRKQKNLKRFLISFFLYSAGVQTILLVAASFGEKELKMESGALIATILLLQLVAIVGAQVFAKVSQKYGNKIAIIIILSIWTLSCFLAFMVTTQQQFYGLAVAMGAVMGGIQSLSRATYAKLLPENTKDTTSYFSFYDVLEKLSIVVGMFSYGFLEDLTNSMRNSVLALAFFFLAGLIVLLTVKMKPTTSSNVS